MPPGEDGCGWPDICDEYTLEVSVLKSPNIEGYMNDDRSKTDVANPSRVNIVGSARVCSSILMRSDRTCLVSQNSLFFILALRNSGVQVSTIILRDRRNRRAGSYWTARCRCAAVPERAGIVRTALRPSRVLLQQTKAVRRVQHKKRV